MKYKIFSCFLCLVDILIVGFSFFMVAWYRSGTRVILRNYYRAFFGFLFIWIVVSLLCGKYEIKPPKRLKEVLSCILRTDISSFALVLIMMYVFRLFYFSRFIVLGTILLSTILELVIFTLIFFTFKFHRESDISGKTVLVTRSEKMDEEAGDFFTAKEDQDEDELPYSPDFGEKKVNSKELPSKWRKYMEEVSPLFNFFSEMLDLSRFPEETSMILKSPVRFNIEHIEQNSQHIFINLHPINDIRRLNAYFIQVNLNLKQGGVFISCGETIHQRYLRFISTYGRLFGNVFYFFDFLFRRICPKIPGLQGMYFALTKGRHRSLSETEMLGRLYYCGFRLIGYREIEGKTFFIAKKGKEPEKDMNPSYGPLIKLRRVGLNGNLIYCYKLRTMHPYSEYLQDYVHKLNSVSPCGKFADDFRIAKWGKILRQYWIDEIPQLINLLKGDLRLIGTRALSSHYFSQYPADIQAMRLKVKPGLIPVYTADKVTTLIDLINSERRYLELREKRPLLTDMTYLGKALFNILTRRVKSLDCYK